MIGIATYCLILIDVPEHATAYCNDGILSYVLTQQNEVIRSYESFTANFNVS